jgi:hypothetical protein
MADQLDILNFVLSAAVGFQIFVFKFHILVTLDIKFCRQHQSCRGQKGEYNHILFHSLQPQEAQISHFKKYSKCPQKLLILFYRFIILETF